MDFTFTPEQDEAAELAAPILKDRATNERMKAVEAAGDRFDRDLWAELGDAGLLGLALPEEYDGAGLGLIELSPGAGRGRPPVAPVPLAAHGPAARLVAELGTDEQKQHWLPGAATGAVDPDRGRRRGARVRSRPADHRGRRRRRRLPAHRQQDARPRRHARRRCSWCRPRPRTASACSWSSPATAASTVDRAAVLSDGDAVARLDLDGVRVGRRPGARRRWRRGRAPAAAAAPARRLPREQLGVTEGALELTATYAKTREQFGRPIGTFQAVSQRLADGYIDVLGQRLTLWQAAWRLDEGLPGRAGGRDREALGRRRRAPARAHDRARARRRRHRPRRRGAPLLHDRQALRVRATAAPPSRRSTSAGRSPPNPRDDLRELLLARRDDDSAARRPQPRTVVDLGASTSPSPRRGPTRDRGRCSTRTGRRTSASCWTTPPRWRWRSSAAGLGGHVVVGLNTTRRGESLLADIRTGDCQLVLTDAAHARLLDGLDLGGVRVVRVDAPSGSQVSRQALARLPQPATGRRRRHRPRSC